MSVRDYHTSFDACPLLNPLRVSPLVSLPPSKIPAPIRWIGRRLFWLVMMPTKIGAVAIYILHRIVDPFVFGMSWGGKFRGGYSRENHEADWSDLLCGGKENVSPQATSLKIRVDQKNNQELKIDAMTFLTREKAPTLVMSFGKDVTYASFSRKMNYLFKNCIEPLQYNLLLIDLPGHGYSNGRATEETCKRAVKAAYHYVNTEWKVHDMDMFFLGQSLSSGLVGSLAEEYPDINPIFVDGYAHLADVCSSLPLFEVFLRPLFNLLYSLNTLRSISSLRGRACIIANQQDTNFGIFPLVQMIQTAGRVQQNAHYILVNGDHGDLAWIDDEDSLAKFKNYLTSTITKSENFKKINSVTTLLDYIEQYKRTFSVAEKKQLAKKVKELAVTFCQRASDLTREYEIRIWPEKTTITSRTLWNTLFQLAGSLLGSNLIQEILIAKYNQTKTQREIAQGWIDLMDRLPSSTKLIKIKQEFQAGR